MRTDFRWGRLVGECMQRLRDSGECAVPFVDWEVMPPFDGRADGIFVWFICRTAALKDRFRQESLTDATLRLRLMAVASGFPSAAAETLQSAVTSAEDIESGGGRFNFFR
jgi:hypothetical protein